jgi:hypothetical protein
VKDVGMTDTPTTSGVTASRGRGRRPFVVGFVIGFLVTVPAIMLALAFTLWETLLPFVVPGSLLLRIWGSAMADWPGLVNVLLACLANGLVYGLVGLAAAAVLRGRRRG